jgi:hypothetical protein
VSGEALAEFLGGTIEVSKGQESVDASADEKSEKPCEGNQEEAADFFRVFT